MEMKNTLPEKWIVKHDGSSKLTKILKPYLKIITGVTYEGKYSEYYYGNCPISGEHDEYHSANKNEFENCIQLTPAQFINSFKESSDNYLIY